VSFGERLSVRLFAALLTAQGCPARPHDAPALGLATTDDFGNAAVLYDLALPALRAGLTQPPAGPRHIPVLTGFLGCGAKSGAVTTLGRGGSDLTATLVGAALGLPEVVLWKDIDGVQTTDPRVVAAARRVPSLTFEEASELSYFGACVLHPLAMVPAAEAPGGMAVRVMNSYNAGAAGTRITAQRDVAGAPAVTALVLKEQVTLIDVSSTKMFGTFGFLARVFGVFEAQQVSVDMIASSEVSVSLTLDPARLWERDLIDDELEALMSDFAGWATASHRRGFAILSLICALDRTNDVLARAFTVLGREGVRVHMISQGSSKPSISLVIRDADAKRALHALHDEYFPPAPR
jgi:aspartate kinase